MSSKVETFLEQLVTTNSLDDLQSLIENMRSTYDLGHVVYHSVSGTGEQYAALTYKPTWVEHYLKQDYSRIDPVVIGALKHFHPMDWKRLDWTPRGAKLILNEAIDTGIGNQGYSIPIRGPNGQFALFTVNKTANDDKWGKYTQEHTQDFLLLSHYVHERANHITGIETGVDMQALSPRERDAMIFLGMGEARGHIAEKMKISEHTLRAYIDSARYKLGAANTTHAVAIAISRGMIIL